MNKKNLYEKKKQLVNKIKEKTIDDSSKELLKKMGFSVKFDSDYNIYIWDDIHNERMYTNILSIAGIPYRSSENKYFTLEFCIFNRKISNISLYNKSNGKTKTYKIKKDNKKAEIN